jgi:hypothetical protein
MMLEGDGDCASGIYRLARSPEQDCVHCGVRWRFVSRHPSHKLLRIYTNASQYTGQFAVANSDFHCERCCCVAAHYQFHQSHCRSRTIDENFGYWYRIYEISHGQIRFKSIRVDLYLRFIDLRNGTDPCNHYQYYRANIDYDWQRDRHIAGPFCGRTYFE